MSKWTVETNMSPQMNTDQKIRDQLAARVAAMAEEAPSLATFTLSTDVARTWQAVLQRVAEELRKGTQ